MLYLNTDDPRNLRFALQPSFFSREVTPDSRVGARALAMQTLVDELRSIQSLFDDSPLSIAERNSRLEGMWGRFVSVVDQYEGRTGRPLGGESPAPQPSEPVIEAPTNSQSRRLSKQKV